MNHQPPSDAVLAKAFPIKLVAMDVDGVLTDGKLYFTPDGEELKAFHSQDGHGIKMLQSVNIAVALITGRCSNAVTTRAQDLKIEHIYQGKRKKIISLKEIQAHYHLKAHEIAYIGDDLPDLAPMIYSGLGVTVPNAVATMRHYADWETRSTGGNGAVRELCDLILTAQNHMQTIEQQLLSDLTRSNVC